MGFEGVCWGWIARVAAMTAWPACNDNGGKGRREYREEEEEEQEGGKEGKKGRGLAM